MSSLACELEGIWDAAMNWSMQFSDPQHLTAAPSSLRAYSHWFLLRPGCMDDVGASFDRASLHFFIVAAALSSSIDHLREQGVLRRCSRSWVREVSIAKSLSWNPISPGTSTDSGCLALAASQAGSSSPAGQLDRRVLYIHCSYPWKSRGFVSLINSVVITEAPQILSWHEFDPRLRWPRPYVCVFLKICKYLAWHVSLSQHQF